MNSNVSPWHILTVVLIALSLCVSLPPQAWAVNEGGGDKDQDKKGGRQNKDYDTRATKIHLTGDGGISQVIVGVRLVTINDDFFSTLGIDAEDGIIVHDINKVDLGNVPLLGDLFEDRYSASDFTESNQIGTVYREAELLVVVTPQALNRSEMGDVSVINGNYENELVGMPVDTSEEFSFELPIITKEMAALGDGSDSPMSIANGLRRASEEGGSKVPVLNKIPALGSLFAGKAYEMDDDTIILLITPTILVGDSD